MENSLRRCIFADAGANVPALIALRAFCASTFSPQSRRNPSGRISPRFWADRDELEAHLRKCGDFDAAYDYMQKYCNGDGQGSPRPLLAFLSNTFFVVGREPVRSPALCEAK